VSTTRNGKKKLKINMDNALASVDAIMQKQNEQKEKFRPILDKRLQKIEVVDKAIENLENIIKQKEEEKIMLLKDMENDMELAMVSTHTLANGYTVKPDNRFKIEINDIGAFMKWLKTTKTPDEVFDFFKTALKQTSVKRFVEKEINLQNTKGIISPEIDGVEIFDISYRRLTTEYKRRNQ